MFVRCYGKKEVEIDHSNAHFNEAIQAGNVISQEQYGSDEDAP